MTNILFLTTVRPRQLRLKVKVLKKLTTTLLIGLAFGVPQIAQAQTTVEKGKSISIEIPVEADTACNIEVVRGGEKTDVRVESNKKGVYQFAGRELGEETIRWEGKMKFRGLKTLGPCSGDGSLSVSTVESAETIKAQEAASLMEAQAAKLAELEAKLKAVEAEVAKTPEQRAEEARIAAEAKARAEAQLAAEIKAAEKARVAEMKAAVEARAEAEARAQAQARVEAQARAAEQARLAEQERAAAAKQAAKDGLLADVFRSKWQALSQHPCNLNGGTYKEFGSQYRWGYRDTLGGNTSETSLKSRNRITVLDEKTFEIGFTGYENGGIVIDQLERFTMLNNDTMENVVVVQRQANLRSQLRGNLSNGLERGAGQGERSVLRRCSF